MSELLPTRTAQDLQESLLDYLTTTFALAESPTQTALKTFLEAPETGLFRGPYVRARIPFKAASTGWEEHLEWYEGHPPYGHQARAFERLSSFHSHPDPTLVVTGTGSGKTEAFLYPILDHVRRANQAGDTGLKAIILYPMNALANDQAERFAETVTSHSALSGMTVALYTGEAEDSTHIPGLVTQREQIRATPPDILLTNYKMLSQILLRAHDQRIVEAAATSLTYLVLDEFHTYDGAQGTDVAMLIRRLGLALKSHRPNDTTLPEWARNAPLGNVTPVATSATLGDEGDPERMLSFAETVFGVPFTPESVITETRLNLEEWVNLTTLHGVVQAKPSEEELPRIIHRVATKHDLLERGSSTEIAAAVFDELFAPATPVQWDTLPAEDLLATIASHPLVQATAQHTSAAVSMRDLAQELLPRGLDVTETFAEREAKHLTFLTMLFAALSHVRARCGRNALSIDVALWVRELSRVDRAVDTTPAFRWSDDGPLSAAVLDDAAPVLWQPAIYCRHCGRSGWAVTLAPIGFELDPDQTNVRKQHASGDTQARVYPLIFAEHEGNTHRDTGETVTGLRWFHRSGHQELAQTLPKERADEWVPVLSHSGDEADTRAKGDTCPSCMSDDGIRFLGSAMATILSVLTTTLFGEDTLDVREKKALVFTDSVQDAAHRAAFIQSRAHTFSLRNAIAQALLAEGEHTLDSLAEALIDRAGNDQGERYKLLPPDLADRASFTPFWKQTDAAKIPASVRGNVRDRLAFDIALEFGLQSSFGRTLELTGAATAHVDVAQDALAHAAETALHEFQRNTLDCTDLDLLTSDTLTAWVRGVLERMRFRGAIEHRWLRRFISSDGHRWHVWGGRPAERGMPAFPPGRATPAFPRVGGRLPENSELDPATSSQSWYATWAKKLLGVTAAEGGTLSQLLFNALAEQELIASDVLDGNNTTVYSLRQASITIRAAEPTANGAPAQQLSCNLCSMIVPGAPESTRELAGAPCFSARCPGHLTPHPVNEQNFYRTLYTSSQMRRIVAREHTGLLTNQVRLETETQFKHSADNADAPNVLVATPTLEMGIDIGDLSTVVLAGIPRTVSSYLQRVGRAGRLTGNALTLAAVRGRGAQLTTITHPLHTINGTVRPPATYLDAQEILRRQYLAFLFDRLTQYPRHHEIRTVQDVLTSSAADTPLGDLLEDAERNAYTRTSEFLSGFQHANDHTKQQLVTWATPGQEPGTSGLAHAIRDAIYRWTTQLEELRHRRDEVSDALPELEKAAEQNLDGQTGTAGTDYRTALATLKLLRTQIKDLTDGYWVNGLELFGLLPNYTLLDDTVKLSAAISWIDPDTQQWQQESASYTRGASQAIREFAPGASFYAQGLEIPIDAVDLGPGGSAIIPRAYCSSCGYHERFAEDTPPGCPRCGAEGLNSISQRLDTVELTRVTAIARREEATITDRSEDRNRVSFTIATMADVDDNHVLSRWFDQHTGFGVTYARNVQLTWLNLGRMGPSKEITLAGATLQAPLFRVCDACGKLDKNAGSNSPRDHRPWCVHRHKNEEHSRSIALSHTLTTQGLMLRLPPAVTLGDAHAIPSLCAAVMWGIYDRMGGDPDHLQVSEVHEPLFDGQGGNAPAVLIHDTVPGGTGYLAEFARHDTLEELLTRVWERVRDCACQRTQRLSCPECLLPHALPHQVDLVSRASAESVLSELLHVSEGTPEGFRYTTEDPGVALTESAIEKLFRSVFTERLTALEATITQIPGDTGPKLQVQLPHSPYLWVLTPQQYLHGTQPDFVLEHQGGGDIPPIAIYTDGKRYHATVQHNRIADDATKRARLREAGYQVLAITWEDLTGSPAEHPWFDPAHAQRVAPKFQLSATDTAAFTDDPMTFLVKWIQQPQDTRLTMQRLSKALPFMLTTGAQRYEPAERSLERLAGLLVTDPSDLTPVTSGTLIGATHGALSTVCDIVLPPEDGRTRITLLLDDRADTLRETEYSKPWRAWLHLSNISSWLPHNLPSITALSIDSPADEQSVTPDVFVPEHLSVAWEEAFALADETEQQLLRDISQDPACPAPIVGLEVGDGIPLSLAWETQRAATATGLATEEINELTADGWHILAPDSREILRFFHETTAERNQA